jgi:hypothetical protein
MLLAVFQASHRSRVADVRPRVSGNFGPKCLTPDRTAGRRLTYSGKGQNMRRFFALAGCLCLFGLAVVGCRSGTCDSCGGCGGCGGGLCTHTAGICDRDQDHPCHWSAPWYNPYAGTPEIIQDLPKTDGKKPL